MVTHFTAGAKKYQKTGGAEGQQRYQVWPCAVILPDPSLNVKLKGCNVLDIEQRNKEHCEGQLFSESVVTPPECGRPQLKWRRHPGLLLRTLA